MIESQDFQHLRRKSRSWHHIAAVVVVVATLVLVVCMLLMSGCAGMADRVAGGAHYVQAATTQPMVVAGASMVGAEPILALVGGIAGAIATLATSWGVWERNRRGKAEAETVVTKEHAGRIVASVEAIKPDIPAAAKEIMHEVQGESTTAFVHEIRDEPVAAKATRRAAAKKA